MTLMILKTLLHSLNTIFHICMYHPKLKTTLYVKANREKLSENNVFNFAEEFLKGLTFSANDILEINQATVGQHKNKTWHKMRHLIVMHW